MCTSSADEAHSGFMDLSADAWLSVLLVSESALTVSRCAAVCEAFRDLVYRSAQLWQLLAARDFGLREECEWFLQVDVASTATAGTLSSIAALRWRGAYAECRAALDLSTRQSTRQEQYRPQTAAAGLISLRETACSDSAGEFAAYYPVHFALRGCGPLECCWCSSSGNCRNVSVCARVAGGYALVTAVGCVNPADGFDNPVKDVVVFGSLSPLSLGSSRFDDGGRDDEAKRLVEAALDGSAEATPRLPPDAPLGGCRFPPFPACRGLHVVRPCAPTVVRFVRFLVLSSQNPAGHTDANVDVSKLQLFGTPLGRPPHADDETHDGGGTSALLQRLHLDCVRVRSPDGSRGPNYP